MAVVVTRLLRSAGIGGCSMTSRDTPRRAIRTRRLALSAMAGLILTACAGTATPGDSPQPGASPAAAVLALPSPSASYDSTGDPIVRVVEAVTPAVVTVRSRTSSANPFFGGSTEGEAVG